MGSWQRTAIGAVVLGLATACSPSSSVDQATPPGPSLTGVGLEELRAEQPAAWKGTGQNWIVTLTWNEPEAPVDHYVVSRDGSVIDNDVSEPRYVDRAIWPSSGYRYEVVAVGDSGKTRPASVHIRTNAPPLEQARLAGAFDVRMVPTAWDTVERPKAYEARFTFDPRCPEGACPVVWDEYYGTAEGLLESNGATYSGTAHGTFSLVDCYGRKVNERIEIEVEVARANGSGSDDRAWIADRIRGTLRQIGPPVAGCEEVSVSWRFRSV
jgi:hypothetical protein